MASQDYLNKYQKAFNQAQGYDVNKFASDLEKAYSERTGYNQDLINQQNALQAEAQALPGQLRESYYQSAIRNPLAQESLIAERQANIRGQLGSVTDLLNARGQQFQDILGKAVGAYQTDAQRAQTQAENLWRMYQDAQAQENARRAASAGANLAGLFGQVPTKSGKSTKSQQPTVTKEQENKLISLYNSAIGSGNWGAFDKYITNTLGKAAVESGVIGGNLIASPIQNLKTSADFYKNLLQNASNAGLIKVQNPLKSVKEGLKMWGL